MAGGGGIGAAAPIPEGRTGCGACRRVGSPHVQRGPRAIMSQPPAPFPVPAPPSGDPGSPEADGDVPRRGRAGGPPRRRLSEILAAIAADDRRERITVGDLLTLMEGRARAALIFVFAFPNVLPAPPGLSAILGLPILYLTAQMMLGRVPWLPQAVAGRGVGREAFAALIARAAPHLQRAERMLRPRWTWLVSPRAERGLGALALALAVVVTLPIPLGNMLPAFAICLIALGVLERDGLWAGLGIAAGLGALVVSGAVAYAMLRALTLLVLSAFA